MTEMYAERHNCLILLPDQSLSVLKHVCLWCAGMPQWFMGAEVHVTRGWSHQTYFAGITSKISHLRDGQSLAQTERQMQISVVAGNPIRLLFSAASSEVSWGAFHLHHTHSKRSKTTKKKKAHVHVALCSPDACTLTNHFQPQAQAHSTFNDPILSTEWRYSQLLALSWHL